jgi:hypothetical protein
MRSTPPIAGKILRLGYDTLQGKILDEVTRAVDALPRRCYTVPRRFPPFAASTGSADGTGCGADSIRAFWHASQLRPGFHRSSACGVCDPIEFSSSSVQTDAMIPGRCVLDAGGQVERVA